MNRFFLFFFLAQLSFLKAQQVNYIDFKNGVADIKIYPETQKVEGEITYKFDVLQDADSLFVDAQNMHFNSVFLDGKKVKYKNTGTKLVVYKRLKSKSNHLLQIKYKTNPKKTMYFIDWEYNTSEKGSSGKTLEGSYLQAVEKQVWTQGQGKYTSNWLPSFDDMNEKVEIDLNITFHKDYKVIANGKLIKTEEKDSLKTWHYDMIHPMSSYLLALAIGDYDKKTEYSQSGIPIEMYYYPEDSLKFEPTYRYTKKIFDFLEEEIGVSYPWQNYKQIPVKDFMYAGMENTTVTIFSDTYVIDSISFIDKNYVNVNAHELAHQWFGNLVTEESGTHHWLHEGFATYYALLAEKEIFGNDYYYWQLYQSSQQLIALSEQEKGESLLNPNASSLTFYEKGAWALHILRQIVGDESFKVAVKNYLEKNKFKNVNTDDFLYEVEEISKMDLTHFKKKWLEQENMPHEDIEQFFYKNVSEDSFIMDIANIEFSVERYIDSIEGSGKDVIDATMYYPAVEKLLSKVKNYKSANEYFLKALNTDNIQVRQAVASSLDTIPVQLQKDFESLLKDKSYITIENALYKLWLNFPDKRAEYLKETKGITGFNDKNIRTMWLALALATPGFEDDDKQYYFYELSEYTSPVYHFEVRQNAFSYLYQIQAFTDQNLKDLVNAGRHHSWRFAKFSGDLLSMLLQNQDYKKRFVDLMAELNEDEANYLLKKIKN